MSQHEIRDIRIPNRPKPIKKWTHLLIVSENGVLNKKDKMHVAVITDDLIGKKAKITKTLVDGDESQIKEFQKAKYFRLKFYDLKVIVGSMIYQVNTK